MIPLRQVLPEIPRSLASLPGSLNTILDYAGSDLDTVTSFRQHVHAYKLLSDRASQDQDVALLRRQLTEEFYLLYSLLFTQTLEQPNIPMPVKMFLYFGYVDEELAGLKSSHPVPHSRSYVGSQRYRCLYLL